MGECTLLEIKIWLNAQSIMAEKKFHESLVSQSVLKKVFIEIFLYCVLCSVESSQMCTLFVLEIRVCDNIINFVSDMCIVFSITVWQPCWLIDNRIGTYSIGI